LERRTSSDHPITEIAPYVADGLLEGEPDADAEGEAVAEGELEVEADGDGELEGEVEADADGVLEGELDAEADAITVPMLLFSTSQRYEPEGPDPDTVTEISGRKSLTSANTACVSRATLKPSAHVTTISPPPSVFIRMVARMPGFLGVFSVRVSPEPPDVSSQICKSLVNTMTPPLPGSFTIFGPR
jgi:hypothetical protein